MRPTSSRVGLSAALRERGPANDRSGWAAGRGCRVAPSVYATASEGQAVQDVVEHVNLHKPQSFAVATIGPKKLAVKG